MARISDPYHAGEIAVQQRMGVRDEADANAVMLRDTPDQPTLRNITRADVVAITSLLDGSIRLDLCGGPTGFATVVGESTVRFDCDHVLPGPLVEAMESTGTVGGLTLGFAARQRARVNGNGRIIDDTTFEISVGEVFFNCTKYIATRSRAGSVSEAAPAGDIAAAIRRADMFFVGSHHPDRGLDASHRGGNAGFVTFEDGLLQWTEYPGNSMFQTLGNLTLHPEVVVLVPDLEAGTQVRFHGTARIDTGQPMSVAVGVDAVSQEPLSLTNRWKLEKPSPHNPQVPESGRQIP